MTKNFIKIGQRIIGQVRFVPTLSSWQDTIAVSKNFEKEFAHWRIANRQDVTLYSPDEYKLFQILYNSLSYINEKEENTEELSANLQKAFTLMNDKEKEFEHLGFRNIQIFGTKFDFSELVDLLHSKIYTNDILQISSDSVNDVLFSINAIKDGINNNVLLGPVTKDEALQRFNSQFDVEKISTKMDEYKSFIYLDVDTYIKSEKNIEKINNLIDKNLEIASSYLEYIIQ